MSINMKYKRLFIMLFMIGALTGICSVQAGAKAKAKVKKVKLHNLYYTTSLKRVEAKAAALKTGKHRVQVKSSGCGYIKFVAPSARTYTITVSGLKMHKRSSLPVRHYWFRIMTVDPRNPSSLALRTVDTQGGKAKNLYFYRKTIRKGSKHLRYRKSRYGKIYLEEGQAVYVYFCCKARDSFKVKIKAKALKRDND